MPSPGVSEDSDSVLTDNEQEILGGTVKKLYRLGLARNPPLGLNFRLLIPLLSNYIFIGTPAMPNPILKMGLWIFNLKVSVSHKIRIEKIVMGPVR